MTVQSRNVYHREECITFLKTNESFGGLSNMASGYPLLINNIRILTSEALYQACRFPHMSEVQKLIIGQRSPMSAKMVGKPYQKASRPDWDEARIKIMYWCLRVKLAQNWEKFSNLLAATENKPIVEVSYRDQFWGAKPVDTETLVGENTLGRLLMKLRDKLRDKENSDLLYVSPPVENFHLLNVPIGVIHSNKPIQPLNTFSQQQLLSSFTEMETKPIIEPTRLIESVEVFSTLPIQGKLFE